MERVAQSTIARYVYRPQSFRGWDDTFFFFSSLFFSPFTLIIDAALRNGDAVSREPGVRTLRNERKSMARCERMRTCTRACGRMHVDVPLTEQNVEGEEGGKALIVSVDAQLKASK